MKHILLLLVLLSGVAAAQTTTKHAIDKSLEACIAKDESTVGMIECVSNANKQWDAELNKNYKLLMSQLDEEAKAKLKASQLEWIKYRDLEFASVDAIYDKMEGTMFQTMRVNSKMEFVKQRAIELYNYYSLFTEGN